MSWARRFLDLAAHVALWSKDPSTRVGAVIVRPDKTVCSLGYNGFPRGVSDDRARLWHRDTKYAMTVHAEINAILHARDPGLHGYTMFVYPFLSCSQCAAAIIQSGIDRVVVQASTPVERWRESHDYARQMFTDADVVVEEIA